MRTNHAMPDPSFEPVLRSIAEMFAPRPLPQPRHRVPRAVLEVAKLSRQLAAARREIAILKGELALFVEPPDRHASHRRRKSN